MQGPGEAGCPVLDHTAWWGQCQEGRWAPPLCLSALVSLSAAARRGNSLAKAVLLNSEPPENRGERGGLRGSEHAALPFYSEGGESGQRAASCL